MLLLMVPGKVMKSVGEVVIDKLLSYVLLVMVHGQVRDYYFCSLLAFFVSLWYFVTSVSCFCSGCFFCVAPSFCSYCLRLLFVK